jgi:hypothetical protein
LSQGIKDNDDYYCILFYPTVTLNFSHYTLFPQAVMTKSQWYNCFIMNGGNAIPKCSCPEVTGSNPTVAHVLLWDCNPLLAFLKKKAGWLIPK